jgi:hypothetical protein
MAGVVRNILEAQAPGVFFGTQARALSYAPTLKTGTLQKFGRGRGVLGGMSKKWAERKVVIHEDFRLQYHDGDKLRGEINLQEATVESVPKDDEHAEGHEFGFRIHVKGDTETMLFSCENENQRQEWIAAIIDAASGKFKLNRYLGLIKTQLKIDETQKINFEYDKEQFTADMKEDGYSADRLIEIFEAWLVPLHQHIARYIAEDGVQTESEFRKLFMSRFQNYTIRILKSESQDTSKGHYQCHFKDGELQIHYVKTWTNIQTLGEDLIYAVSEGDEVPYIARRSIVRFQPVIDSYMKGFENLLKLSNCSYDYCIVENYHAMTKGGFTADRFAEIFIQEHLKTMIEKLTKFVAADYQGFIPKLTAKWTSHKLVIKPDESQSDYYVTKFVNGDLVITYKQCWTNLGQMLDDLPSKI